MYLIFDTETTGLPKNWNAPVSDIDNWPRCVQIAWQIHDSLGNCIENKDFLIKPDGYNIPLQDGLLKELETILLPSTIVRIIKQISPFVVEVSTEEYSASTPLWTDNRFLQACDNIGNTLGNLEFWTFRSKCAERNPKAIRPRIVSSLGFNDDTLARSSEEHIL